MKLEIKHGGKSSLSLLKIFCLICLIISGTLEDIQPINGFKWAVGGWELIIEKGLTDDEG